MRKIITLSLVGIFTLGLLGACSPYRAKKRAPKKGVSFLDFRKAHCGCVGK